MVNNLIFDQERMSCACTQHIFISIEHASHRFTSPRSGIPENHGQENKKNKYWSKLQHFFKEMNVSQ